MAKDSDIKSVRIIDKALGKEDNTITLSTGVVLRGKQVPPLILIKIVSSYSRPKIPTWISPEMGREVENPEDPDYIERVKNYRMELSDGTLNALIVLGTELVKLPKGFEGPKDNKWLDKYKVLGLPMFPENENWRYLSWMTMVGAPEKEDLDKIKEVVGRLSGIPESKVEAAEEFPAGN
jgi:hypothetical protein